MLRRTAFTAVILGIFLATLAAAQTAPAPAPSLLVKLVAGLTPAQQADVITRNGGVEKSIIPALRLHVVEVPAEDLDAALGRYQADSQVERAEVNQKRQAEGAPSDALYPQQWHLPKIGWGAVFGRVFPLGSATVALLDTGVDASHPELSGRVLPGISFLDSSDGCTDPLGHGTWLAGLIVAATGDAVGVAGVAYQGVSLLPVRVLDANGLGQDSDVINGVVWAADNGADVILMAFSNPGFSSSLQEAVDYAWDRGAVLVAATGNNGVSVPSFPAGDRGVVGVSATDPNDSLAPSSNYGSEVFLGAPGTDLLTTDRGTSYVTIAGTSGSAAIVAAAAAFLKAADPTLTNGVIVGRLARTADPAGTRDQTGNGRVNLARALADTGTDPVQPVGAPDGGGPFVGPYVAAAGLTISFSGSGAGSVVVALTGSSTYTIPSSVGFYAPTLSPNQTGSLTASPDQDSKFSGWSGTWNSSNPFDPAHGTTTCAGTVTPCDFDMGNWAHYITANFASKTPQQINVTTEPPASAVFGTSSSVAAVGGASGNLVVITASGGCTNVDGGVTMISGTTTCEVRFNQAGNDDYKAAPGVTRAVAAQKADATISVSGYTGVYDGNAHGATGTATGVKGEALAGLDLGASFTNVPGGTATWTFTDVNGNYKDASGTTQVAISKADPAISVSGYTGAYDGDAHGASGSATGAKGETLTGLYLGESFTNVPGGTANWTFTDVTGNYNNTGGTATIEIRKADPTISVSGYTGVYDGNARGATGSATGAKGETLTGLYLGESFTNVPGGTANWTFTDVTGNYNNTSGTATIEISKADATINVSGYTGVYGGNAHGATGSATGVKGEALAGLALGASFTDVPGGTATWAFTGGTNYNDQTGSVAIVISKADATVTVSGYTGVYDGDAHGPTGSATGVKSEALAGLALGASFTNVPGGTATWTFTDVTGNYKDTSGTATIEISKADATINVSGYTGVYDGDAHGATGSATGVKGEALAGLALGASFANVPGGTASWTFTDVTGNYKDASGTTQVVISEADPAISVSGYTGVYDGDAHGATGAATGVKSEALAGLALGARFTNVPGGMATWTFTDVTGNYKDASGTTQVVISKADPAISVSGYTGVYDGNAHGASGSATGVKGEALAGLDLGAKFADVPGGTAYWTFSGGTNYNDQTGSTTVDITALEITGAFTASDKTYDGTASATVATRSLSSVVSGDAVSLDGGTAAFADKNAGGDKTVKLEGASLGGGHARNYRLTSVGTARAAIFGRPVTGSIKAASKAYDATTDATITERTLAGAIGGDAVRLDGGSAAFPDKHVGRSKLVTATGLSLAGTDSVNYTVNTTATDTVDITARAITVTAATDGKTYDGSTSSAGTPTITSGSLANGDGASWTQSFDNKGVGTAKTLVPAGSVSDGNGGNNYTVTFVAAAGAITARPLAVSATAVAKVYDGTTTATVTLSDDRLSGDVLAASYGSATFANQNVGIGKTVTVSGISISGTDAANYAANATASARADITVRPITVTAEAKTKTYGAADPTLTYRITTGSLAPGDGFAGGLARDPGENVGTYAIQQGSLALSANYDLSYVGADLTVGKRPITVTAEAKTKTYGTDDPALTLQFPAGSLAPGDGFAGGLTRAVGENVGIYAIQQGSLALSANYDLTFVGAALTIAPRPASVTPTAASKTYGSADPALDGTLSGFLAGDNVTAAYSRTAGETVAGSPYTIGATLSPAGVLGNYVITHNTAIFAINKGPAAVTLGNLTQTYTGAALTPAAATAPGGLNVVWTNAAQTNAGSYAVTATVDDPNYQGSAGGTFVIQKAAATVTLSDLTRIYTGSLLTPVAATKPANLAIVWTNTPRTNAGANSVTATVDDLNYEGSATDTFTINKANPTISVTPYGVTYDGAAHTAAGTAKGAKGESLAGLDLSGTTHTDAGTYTDTWIFTDVTGNYNDASGTVSDAIAKADAKVNATITVVGYTGTYDGTAHGASGTATGVGGVDLSSRLNLGGSFTNAPGGTVHWTFTGGADYNDASGDVAVVIAKADALISVLGTTAPYDRNPHGATGTAKGVKGESLSGLNLGQSFTNVPGGTASWTFSGDTNYKPASGTVSITITKVNASATPNNASALLGAADPAFTGTLSGFLASDGVTATYSRVPGGTVGTYTISAVLSPAGVLGNYEITYRTATFSIYYDWAGFLQPINDTAHQIGLNQSKFKLGQTIPAKFVLKDAGGAVVQQDGNPTFTRSGRLGACDAYTVPETVEVLVADTTPQYKWDGSQYHYNWSTKGLTAGEYRIYANLADGTQQWVDICLTK